jgi:hypothetical protein
MAYRDFTLERLRERFGIRLNISVFSDPKFRIARKIETAYEATISGTTWRFLRLTGSEAEADLTEHHISQVKKILSILIAMLSD